MKPIKNKIFAIAIVIMFAMSVSAVVSVQTVRAQTNIQPYAFVAVSPNPIGIGQNALVAMWFDLLPPINATTGAGTGWTGWVMTITLPDNTTTTMGPFHSDAVGSHSFIYVPQELGTYYFQWTSPQQTQQYAAAGNVYLAATSNKAALVVQQTPIQPYSEAPLPTGYWARPIYGNNEGWYVLGGNWLAMNLVYGTGYDSSGCFNPYTTGPNSAHILWTRVQTIGGIAGGNIGIGQGEVKSFTAGASAASGSTYYTGLSYESRYGPPIVLNGYLYSNVPESTSGTLGGAECINIKTGQLVWTQNITVTYGQVLSYESPNQHGIIPYLWRTGAPAPAGATVIAGTSTYQLFDPLTGDLIMQFTNASTGRVTMDTQGDMLVYVLSTANHWLAMWNSSYAPYMQGSFTGTPDWRPPFGGVVDWRAGVEWNVTIPATPVSACISTLGEGVIIATGRNATTLTNYMIGYDMTTGTQLFQTTFVSNTNAQPFLMPIGGGVVVFFRQELLSFYAYNIHTGALVWGPTTPYTNAFGMYTSSTVGLGDENPNIAYGNLYSVGYDGMIHAYNLTNGNNEWNWYDGSAGFESPYGQNPLGSGTFDIADGKVYAATGEHSPPSPLFRGAQIYCVDANTGTEVWSLLGWWQCPTIADGVLTAFNNYDGLIYGIGKGLSATTVQAPLTGVTAGSTVSITGTVTDQSPGQTCLGIPAAGTPAISDASMSAWMQYLYMQQPMPNNATGVTVQLVAIDSSGASTTIGTATSDVTGFYATSWNVPTAPGVYKIIANFAGTNSYFSSSSEAAITVVAAAPTPTPTPVPTPSPSPSPYPTLPPALNNFNPMDIYIAMIITIIVVVIALAVVAMLLMRRMK